MRNLNVVPLCLTPLTPIHIGCGVDFEPTNYVIDDDVLLAFDPSRVLLDEADGKALRLAIDSQGDEAIRRVQKFFFDRKALFCGVSHLAVMVAPGVRRQYENRVGQVAQREQGRCVVNNQLEIERTVHHPHTGIPYLPGSSLKGSMRTAWLNTLNNGAGKLREDESAQDIERRLLAGRFHTDPFRLVRVVDACGTGAAVSKIVFATNHKKRLVKDKRGNVISAKGPSARREVIVGGLYRAFTGEIRFDSLGETDHVDTAGKLLAPTVNDRIADFSALAQACNRHYVKRLKSELGILSERRLAAPEWVGMFERLVDAIYQLLMKGELMLLRVGRHSGADSITLDGVRSIKIMSGKGRQAQYSRDGATTLWLAADNEEAYSDLVPFGWLLVEPAGSPENTALGTWCAGQLKPDLTAALGKLSAARKVAAAGALRREQLARERSQREAEEQRAQTDRLARKASLSEEGRLVEELHERLEKHRGHKQAVSGNLYAEVQKLVRAALQGNWSDRDRRALADVIEGLGFDRIDFAGRTRDMKRTISQLRSTN